VTNGRTTFPAFPTTTLAPGDHARPEHHEPFSSWLAQEAANPGNWPWADALPQAPRPASGRSRDQGRSLQGQVEPPATGPSAGSLSYPGPKIKIHNMAWLGASDLGEIAADDGIDQWALANGGYDVGMTQIRLVVQGIDKPVTIVNARARILGRVPVPTNTLIIELPQGGGDTIKTDLDLDKTNEASATYFANHSISLQPGESATIDLNAAVTQSAVVWDLVLDVVVEGEHRTVTVTRGPGLHFRTAAWSDGRQHSNPDDPAPPYGMYSHGFLYDVGLPRPGRPADQPGGWKSCVPSDCSYTPVN